MIRAFDNQLADDFAKQLLTTLSTLVVAVAGFYFGAKSVETGAKTAQASQPAGRLEATATSDGETTAAVVSTDATNGSEGAEAEAAASGSPGAETGADRGGEAVESPPDEENQ